MSIVKPVMMWFMTLFFTEKAIDRAIWDLQFAKDLVDLTSKLSFAVMDDMLSDFPATAPTDTLLRISE